ncbi:MAG: hypothetical protein ACTSQ7_09235 [Alphaproteobacteria bacterium]
MTETETKPDAAAGRSALDGPAARLVALAVFLVAAGALGWFHRDDILPPEAGPLADDPAALCIAERWAGIDAMAAEGTIDAARAKQFKASAEAVCRSQAGGN